ncbi:MAG: ECF-type sigma factor [Pseudomonadales bacterium]
MEEITQVLGNWANEPRERKNLVFDALYAKLRQLAGQQVRKSGDNLDMQPTALVHEAYFRLVDLNRIDINGRAHFLGLAGRLMREILVDEARHARAQKRDRALETRLTGEFLGDGVDLDALLMLNETLNELGEIDPEYLWLADARLFAGMTIEEAADGLGVSPATVKRKWRVARAWIAARLKDSETKTLRDLTNHL